MPASLSSRDRHALSRTCRGFTLIELMVVVSLIAIAAGLISLSLRDPASTQLENEAARLVALLESARAESRASGIPVRWEPRHADAQVEGFQFKGLTNPSDFPQHWLGAGVSAEIVGAQAIALGPEPFIPPQRIVLRLDDQRLALATDGLGPFVVIGNESNTAP
jgi:general secretion pathway protein H